MENEIKELKEQVSQLTLVMQYLISARRGEQFNEAEIMVYERALKILKIK
jgi:hypothetical protein